MSFLIRVHSKAIIGKISQFLVNKVLHTQKIVASLLYGVDIQYIQISK